MVNLRPQQKQAILVQTKVQRAILGIDGMSHQDILREIDRGGKFVFYHYAISILVLSFRRSSNIYFIKAGSSGVGTGLGFTAVSLLAGWWGIPWGPIYTVQSLITNCRGGINVTKQVIAGGFTK